MSTIKHTEKFVIRSYEVDETGQATLPVIANYFQEAAGKNARDLNFDIEDLYKKGVTWVLYRMHIKIEKFPERWEKVCVNTWPSSGDGIRAYRDYQLMDKNGTILGVGISQWMVLNIKNRRPVRVPEEILKMGLKVKNHQLPVDKTQFPEMGEFDSCTSLTAGRHDLDMNRHVNNVTYIQWMTGFMPENHPVHMTCTEINIQYHRECKLGQNILVKTKQLSDSQFLHIIEDVDTQTMLAEGTSNWK